METEISLPDSLFYAVDSIAKRTGMSQSEMFQAAVADYIEAHKYDQVQETLDVAVQDKCQCE